MSELFTRDLLRKLSKAEYPSDKPQIELSDTLTSGLKLLWYRSGKLVYYASFMANKKKVRVRLGCASLLKLSDAREGVQRLKVESLEFGAGVKGRRLIFLDLVDEYLQYSTLVKKSYRSDISRAKNHLLPVFGNQLVANIDRVSANLFYCEMQSKSIPLANRTLNLLKAMLTFAVDKGYLKSSPINGFKLLPEVRGVVPRVLTPVEVHELCVVLDRKDNRDAANLIKFLVYTGIRLDEASKLRTEHYCQTDGTIRLVDTKGGGDRVIPLSINAVSILDQQLKSHGNQGYIFRGKDGLGKVSPPSRFFKRVLEVSGIGDCRIHDLRHTFGSTMVGFTGIYQVKTLMSHASVKTTELYLKDDVSDLKKSLNRLSNIYTPKPNQEPS